MSYVTPTDRDDATTPPEEPAALVPYGPSPPPWYKKPPRPELSAVLDAAEAERAMHDDRVQQGLDMLRRITDPTMAGFFARLAPKIKNHLVEQVWLPGLRDETDMIVSTFSQMDWVVEAQYRSNLHRDEAAAKEDLDAYLRENAQRQYARGGGALLKAAKLFDLVVFGCVAEFNGLDVDNDECGLRMRLVDPNTIFPVWEGERGLSCVYLKYQAEASDVIGQFGSLKNFDEEAVRARAESSGAYDPHHMGEVVEYWDRNWGLIAFESEQVCLFEHGYAEVPFVVTPGNFEQPAHVTTASLATVRRFAGENWRTDRSDDLRRIYAPFLQRRVSQHHFEEAVVGVAATMYRRALNPPRTLQASVLTYEDETPVFTDDDGTTTKLRVEDVAAVNDAAISLDPQLSATVFATIAGAKATSTPSSVLAGQAPMSQGSGTALNVLARFGAERWALVGAVMEEHEAAVTEQRFRFIRDYGSLIGMDGTLYVPRRRANARAGEAPAHEVTSDLLKETGVRVTVRFRHFNPSELASLSQGVGMLRSINLIPKREAIEIIGYTDDPDRAIEDMNREMLSEAPEIMQADMLDMLIDELQEAGWRGSEEDARDLFYRLMYVSDKLDTSAAQRTIEKNQATMAAQMSAMPGVNGMPLPGSGQPGTDGGRPPGGGTPIPGIPGPAGPPPVGGG